MKNNTNIQNSNEEIFGNIWISILLPSLCLLATLGVCFLINKLGLLLTIYFLVSVIIVFLTVEISVIYIVNALRETLLDKSIDKSLNTAKGSAFKKLDIGCVGITGIYPEEEIAELERQGKFNEIWLVSHDLSTEIEEGVYSGVVFANLCRNIQYIYFVPDTPIVRYRVSLIKKDHNVTRKGKNLKFYFLDDSFFFLVPKIDFAIYEPNKTISQGKMGFLGIDIDGLPGRYETQMSPSFVEALVAKLSNIKNNSSEV